MLIVEGDQVFSMHNDLKICVWARWRSAKEGALCIESHKEGSTTHNLVLHSEVHGANLEKNQILRL